MAFTDLASTKLNAYAATRPGDLAAAKLNAYAAAGPADLIVTKVLAYAVTFTWPYPVTVPAIYPTLPGLGYSVIRRPQTYTANARSGSGWQVRVAYASTPTWEWDLTYELLSDQAGSTDLRNLLGIFLAMDGDLTPFLFLDPDDNSVTGMYTGTGDGSTTIFQLQRGYGAGTFIGTEPIGYLNTGATFNVYLNGVLQSNTTYSTATTTPVNQQLVFNTAPGAGVIVTVDMSYYFYAHFKDNTNDFEKFMNQLWTMKKITLESLRG